ncbi:MAG: SIS domain-containing protein [Streptosporangiaceae bacterium]
MEPVAPDVMVRQVDTLASDLRALAAPVTEQVRAALRGPPWSAVRQVYLTGAGDSHYASRSVEMAFETVAGVACRAISAQFFNDYAALSLRLRQGPAVVIAASASGRTPEAVAALRTAREQGAATVAVTCRPDSPLTMEAGHSVVAELADLERSPGIRTYQATLLGLLTTAVELAALRGTGAVGRQAPGGRLGWLADHVAETALTVKERCVEVAEAIAAAPTMAMLGSGPSLGAAMFGAAKMAEAAGVPVLAQDLDEWWHVERRVAPADMPLFVIAPPGQSHVRASYVAAAGRRLGRRVIAVVDERDEGVTRHADAVLPVPARVREEFSPVLYHLFAGYLAAFVARRRGRLAFEGDPPDLPGTLEQFG